MLKEKQRGGRQMVNNRNEKQISEYLEEGIDLSIIGFKKAFKLTSEPMFQAFVLETKTFSVEKHLEVLRNTNHVEYFFETRSTIIPICLN